MSRFNTFKKIILVAGLLFAASKSHATDVAYTGTFQGTEGPAKKTGQTQNATYTRDMNTTGNLVSFQIVYTTYTGNGSQSFTDGSASTGSVTVASNSFVLSSTPTLKINGVNIVYVPVATSTGTAKAISDSIMANGSLNTIIHSTWTGTTTGVVTATATSVGTSTNYTITSSSNAALTPSGATMTGGTNSAYLINTPSITIASNGFTTGLPVLYSTGGVALGGLTNQTTYYVSLVNPNTLGLSNIFKLSTTSSGAVAGVGITLTSSSTATTADTFTLAPLTFSNTNNAGMQIQFSDDGVNYYNAALSSVTFASTGGNTLYDLGVISHRYLRLNETAPTVGAVSYTATDNERYTTIH